MSAGRRARRTLAAAFWPDVCRHWGLVALAYACRTVSVVAALIAPWTLKVIVDHVVTGAAPPSFAILSRLIGVNGVVVAFALAGLIVAVIGALTGAAEKNLSATTRERLTSSIRDRVLTHLLTLPIGLRTTHRSGELVLRIVDDTDLFVRVLTKTIPQVFQHGLTLAATLVALAWINGWIAVASLAWLPIVVAVLRRDGRRLWQASREKRTREGDVTALAQEIVRGMAVVQASGTEQPARDAFARVNESRAAAGRAETRVSVTLERNLQLVQAVAMAVTTGLGALLVLRGHMTLGDLTLLSLYTSQLLKPIEKLNDMAETTGRGLAGGERLVTLLQQSPAVVDDVQAADVGRAHGVLELRNVWFAYPDRPRPVLRGVDLRAAPGSLTVLVGPSGAGKSTLFALLVRLADPTRGDIRLDGRSIRDVRLSSLRAQFAVLSQDTHVFAGTIRDALLPAGRATRDDDLWRALALVSLDGFVLHLPLGLDTPLGEDALNLSGGQRRRIALARAFLLDRPILLLDEPLANIDTESASIILQALDTIRATTTCLATTHDRALTDRADRVLRLDDGRLVTMREPGPTRLVTAVAQ